jgi:hypothetical protein
MSTIPLSRYAPGGDIYATFANQYGTGAADKIYQAAQTGDRAQLSDAIANANGDGAAQDESTADAFFQQITTDPLAAPLGSANNLLANSVLSVLKNPWVLATILAVLFFVFDGADLIRALVKKKARNV